MRDAVYRWLRMMFVCSALITTDAVGLLAQSATDQQLATFLPSPMAGLSAEPPPWQARVPGAPAWTWAPPTCSLNDALGDHCVGYVTAVVTQQYFVVDSALVRQMIGLQPKLQAAQHQLMKVFQEGHLPTREESAQVEVLSHEEDSLKRGAEFVTLSIRTNAAPHIVPMGDSLVDSMQGHPLYRRTSGGPTATLAVFLAPPGFTLGPTPDGKPRAEVKCVLVTADLPVRREALGRALLARVNYAGLEGMIER